MTMKRTPAALMPLKGNNRRASHREIINGLKRGLPNKDIRAFILLYLFLKIFAEQAFRFYKEYYDEDDEGISVLVFTRYVTCSQALDEPQQYAAEHCPWYAAYAAEDRCCKGLDAC